MEDVGEAVFLLLEDPASIGGDSWAAEAYLLETASVNLAAEARGPITVFGKSLGTKAGSGRIIHASGNFSLLSDGAIRWHCASFSPGKWILRPLAWRYRLLHSMSERLESTSRDTFTFLSALILGRRIDTGSRIIRYFREAGCMHLLALSGFHVGLIAIAVRRLTKALLGIRGASAASLAIVIFYLLLVGFRPSLVRAVLMYGLWTRDQRRGYRISPVNYLAAAFVLQIVFFPRSVSSLSFVLSYAALAGILVGGLSLTGILSRYLPKQAAAVIGIGFGAQASTLPIVVKAFGIWRPIAIVSSALLTPFVALSMAAGTILMFIPAGKISKLTALTLDYMTELMTQAAWVFSQAPSLRIAPFLSWLLMGIGTILPSLYKKSHVHAVEPQLPRLNPQVSGIPRNCAAQTLGPKLPHQSRRTGKNHPAS